jgi:hypothetical protein
MRVLKVAAKANLLAAGNPQIPKADGDAHFRVTRQVGEASLR